MNEVLWAMRNLKFTTTGITPYWLVYGQDAVLSIEINVASLRLAGQQLLVMDEYQQAILMESDSVDDDRLATLIRL